MKHHILKFLSGMLVIPMAIVSCTEEETLTENTLEVTPSETITFEATGNEPVILTVTTDAESWEAESQEWIVTEQEGNMLTVTVRDNAGPGSRTGRITVSAGNAEPVRISVVQNEPEEEEDILSVTPTDPISFNAAGNSSIRLEVSTNVEDWQYEVSADWVTVTKEDAALAVNVQDNAGENQRIARLTITAGEAAPVNINISQAGRNPESVSVSMSDAADGKGQALVIEKIDPMPQTLKLSLDKEASENVELEMVYDEAYLSEYNYTHSTDYQLYPAELISFGNDGTVTFNPGETTAETTVIINPDSYALRNNVEYLIPVAVRAKSSNASISSADMHVNYIISRKCKKERKTILYFEVNDVNPLNALEYRLEDGSMFFDAVVLFAANINLDYNTGMPILHNNPNVQALLDETDVYLQPLRQAGIKVYLGILGNHDPAGVCQLSKLGAQTYAQTLAQAVKQYKLDGVSFDDEYSQSPNGSEYLTTPSAAAGARLCYETKKAMSENVEWETEVSIYQYGNLSGQLPSVDGHRPGEFIDIAVADYGMAARQLDGMSKSQCSVMSVELNLDRGDVSAAYRAETGGYGWMMFFSFNPCKEGKLQGGINAFTTAADGLWGMRLLDPENIYEKIGEGQYDPEPHPIPYI